MDLSLNDFFLTDIQMADLAALWKLRLIRTEQLQRLASDLLSLGIVSEKLIEIMACSVEDDEKLSWLFDGFLSEGRIAVETNVDALRQIGRKVSKSIVSGQIAPEEGARFLWDAVLKSKERDFHEFDEFIYAASEMADRVEDRAFFERGIRDAARRWLEVG